ncbi:hypothetical protein V6N13_033000 [Hibiscus sabdariffa]
MVQVHGNACLESVVVMRTLDRKLHAFDVLSEYDGAKWNCDRTIADRMGQYRISQRAEAISIFDKTFKQLRSVLCRCRNRFHSLNLKVHGNVCPESVVVTQTLDRKLHAFDVLSEYDGANGTATGPFLGNACVDAKQLPRRIVSKKIFPLLTSALEYGSAAAHALNALLKFDSWLSVEEFNRKKKTVTKMDGTISNLLKSRSHLQLWQTFRQLRSIPCHNRFHPLIGGKNKASSSLPLAIS